MAPVIVITPTRGLFRLGLDVLWHYRELLYFLVWRDFKVRYKQTLVGVAWALVTPLFSVFVLTMVFGVLARIPSEGIPYGAFAFAGFLPWNYFSGAVTRATNSLVANARLVTKIYFPRLIIPAAATITPVVDLGFALFAMAGLMAWYRLTPHWAVFMLPLFVVYAAVTALAFGMWFAPINARFRDVSHTIPLLIQCWMYISPVVYPASLVPERWRLLYGLNPLVGLVEGFRWTLLGTPPPEPHTFLAGACVVLILFLAGAIFFGRMERTLADVV